MPVPYYVNENGSDDLGAKTFTIVQQAAATWQRVPCSYFRLEYKGKTTKEAGHLDKTNVISWEEKNWIYGSLAAAATSYGGKGDLAHSDIVFNGVDFTWKEGGGTFFTPYVVDPQAVITHEMGHLLGLSHTTADNVTTMAAAYVVGGTQVVLGSDDKLGICKLYPAKDPKDECATNCDCPVGSQCKYFSEVKIKLCDPYRDPLNTVCSHIYNNCPGVCVFYDFDTYNKKAAGYCSVACAKAGDACANGWACKESTTTQGKKVLACNNPVNKPTVPPHRPRNCPDSGVGGDAAQADAGVPGEDSGSCSLSAGRPPSMPPLSWIMLLLAVGWRRLKRRPLITSYVQER